MASVTNNLTRISDVEGSLTSGNIPSGGGGAGANTDIYLQDSQSLGRRQTNVSDTGGFALVDAADNDCSASGTHVGMWIWVTQYALLDNLRVSLGTGTTPASNYRYWSVPLTEYPSLGGWKRVWVENNVGGTVGAGTYTTSQTRHYGVQVSFTSAPGGTSPNLILDSADYGTGAALTLTGTSGVWDDFTTADENNLNQYGVVRNVGGVYNLLARVQLGTSGSSLVFTDSGWTLVFPEQSLVADSWMGVDVDLQNASTSVTWSSSTVVSSGTKKGDIVVTGTAGDFTMDGCTLSNLRLVTLTAGATVEGSLITGSGQVTLGGATMDGCTISNSTATSALLVGSSVSTLSNTAFISSGTGHAIEITGGTTHTLNGITFTGYAASNGSTGNEAVYVNIASGSVTINSDSALSYRTAGATVTVVAGQKTLTVTGIVSGSDVVILTAGTDTVLAINDGATNPVTSFAYSYTYSASTFVDVAVYKAGYVPYIVRNYELQNGNASLPVAQVVDRNYTP
jgi:hypothetical protein